ncbi:5-amino-6-(5-phospho-D-ribitylamino)uracil phosphatase, chloroplastic-like [Miscanthus floridulus]|uniref:5-amino-6-(5-phospho-D-ribitylamino)uracil phosphatase, chloroplastic-like n=1 Tax=Miscanthus floridulus TaxID=154761 RepID=UPI00345A18A7
MESCSFRAATAPSPFPSALSSSSSSLRAPCPILRFLRPRKGRQIGVRRRASGFDTFPPLPGKVFVDEAIGAEYGEGFETFRMDGPLKVDVDYLNEKLQECFLQRIRHAMKPDEAFGLIFSWDNVIADTDSLKLNAWRQLALEEGKDIPSAAHVRKSILHGAADHVLRKVLYWAKEEAKMEKLKARLIELYYENLFKLDTPVEGLREWLDAVQTAGIPCAVASSLDRRCMIEALDRMALSKYFKAIVTDEDDMESIANRFLSAAMKLDRKPSKCVVFEDDPRGVTAAHNCTMMAVALIGAHPAYELVQADLAIAKYSELSVINLRRLFANKGISFMDLQKQIIEKSPPKRRLTVDTIF